MVIGAPRTAQSRRPQAERQCLPMVDYPHAHRGSVRPGPPGVLLRVLPSEDGQGLHQPLPNHPGAQAPQSGFRLGDLGRRRLHPTQDRRDRGPDPAGDRPDRDGAPELHRVHARSDRRDAGPPRGGWYRERAGAGRRPASGLRASAGRVHLRERAGGVPPLALELLPGRGLLSRDAPGGAQPRGGSREPRAQGERRRRLPDHAATSTTRTTSPSSSAPAPRGSRCRSFRASCRS